MKKDSGHTRYMELLQKLRALGISEDDIEKVVKSCNKKSETTYYNTLDLLEFYINDCCSKGVILNEHFIFKV